MVGDEISTIIQGNDLCVLTKKVCSGCEKAVAKSSMVDDVYVKCRYGINSHPIISAIPDPQYSWVCCDEWVNVGDLCPICGGSEDVGDE